ncbi:hypothetical protein CDIK_3416 [Cucumispora dikerogammari]|nr:hypothetical protein CDIK_3416 [Cucumispora dikerogammari]
MTTNPNNEQNFNKNTNNQTQKKEYQKINNHKRADIIRIVFEKELISKYVTGVLNIKHSTVRTVLAVFKNEKRVNKNKQSEAKKIKAKEEIENRIENIIFSNRRATLKQISSQIEMKKNTKLSISTIANVLKTLQIIIKKLHRSFK